MPKLSMAYGIFVYLLSVATLAYTIAFVLDLPVPHTVSSGPSRPFWTAVLGNVGLLSLFGLQHSIMARPAFKRVLCSVVPAPVERSTYCLATCAALIALFVFWSPIETTVWSVTTSWIAIGLRLFAWAGFGLLLLASFQLNHFELFGLQQPWYALTGRSVPTPHFRMPALYAHVRHPIYLGMLMGIWSTPHMTQGHLLFAAVATAYIFVGSTLEEIDLATSLGAPYKRYQREVSRLVPVRTLLRRGGAKPSDPA
ncbi:MAG: protein-S-isoprenylcysteine O-methyltransferase Ste14 [Planctomycetota bacterium]|jgi:protein-S-isoprenylcysteine O-methyltransferase Ste14